MSATNDRYNTLVSRSQLTNNFGNESYEQINNALIPCDEIITFYKDSLFYMHFYNTLYLEFYLVYQNQQLTLVEFDDIIRNLKIIFDNGASSSDDSKSKLGKLVLTNDSPKSATFTFYINLFKQYYHNADYYAYYRSAGITSSSAKTFRFNVNLPKNDPSTIGGTPAMASININLNTGVINKDNDKYITVTSSGSGFKKSDGVDTVIYNSDYNPPLVNLNPNNGIFERYFTNEIVDLKITVNSDGNITSILPVTTVRGDTAITTLTPNSLYTTISNFEPKIESIPLISTGSAASPSNLIFDFNDILDINIRNTFNADGSTHEFTYNSSLPYNTKENIVDNNYTKVNVRRKQFRKVIETIFTTHPYNFFGFLLYQKVNQNVIVCNIAIQLKLRKIYLNEQLAMTTLPQTQLELDGDKINSYIQKQRINLSNLRKISSIATSDYVIDKKSAVDRINLLNNLKKDFNETLEDLNSSINNYNRYIIYYSNLKKYASAIIVFIIMLIIASILITLSPTIDYNAKNSYYIVIISILIILTIIYYLKFRHVGLYEKFLAAAGTSFDPNSHTDTFRLLESDFSTKCVAYTNGKNIQNPNGLTFQQLAEIDKYNKNHTTFSNRIFKNDLAQYNYVYLLLSNELSSAIYVSNNKIFSEGNNEYLYKLYLEKTKHNELNKLKIVKYANIIEAIKKQIIYLFNIALLLSLITIVLVTCLMFYNYGVVSITSIITFAVIALIIIMFYISYIMIQQTRMLASKKYWSVNNPSEVTLNQL